MLDKFRDIKLKEIERLKQLEKYGNFPPLWQGSRPSFSKKLVPENELPAIIAEYKRASPSRGVICETVRVTDATNGYMKNGASALSILTETDWFLGDLEFTRKAYEANLNFHPAILRKDFIFHGLQIRESAAFPVSAVLLIVRMIQDARLLRELQEEALKYDLECVVEIFDETELELARQSGAKIIQVNSRNLQTLKVDRQACINLINKKAPLADEKWIAASGITSGEQLRNIASAGYHAALVGSFLMENGNPGQSLSILLNEARNAH